MLEVFFGCCCLDFLSGMVVMAVLEVGVEVLEVNFR